MWNSAKKNHVGSEGELLYLPEWRQGEETRKRFMEDTEFELGLEKQIAFGQIIIQIEQPFAKF